MKANFAERVIQMLKQSLWGYIHAKINYRYIDVLKDIVHSYNNMKHHTTGMKPSEITKGHVERCLWWHLYKPKLSYEKSCEITRVPFAYKKDDKVHISHMVKTFERAYDEKWMREIFKIVQSFKCFGIRKYHLCDLDGEEVKGTFYEPELQLVDYSAQGSFKIEMVIKKRGCGKKEEVLVKWKVGLKNLTVGYRHWIYNHELCVHFHVRYY